jgi:hypothetical protein
MVDVQTIGVIVTAASVSVAAIYYAFTLRINMKNQQLSLKAQELTLETQKQTLETRKAQVLMGIYDKFAGGLWDNIFTVNNWKINTIDDFMEIYSENGWSKGKVFNETFALFETLGTLLHENLIDINILARFIGGFYKQMWERWGPYIKQARVLRSDPRGWIEAEYFYDRLMDFAKQNPEYHILDTESSMSVDRAS